MLSFKGIGGSKMKEAAMGSAAFQFEFFRRLSEIMEKQRPKSLPCQNCGRPIPVKRIVKRENKVLCEKCYEKLYVSRKVT